jgi:hypothetical protein
MDCRRRLRAWIAAALVLCVPAAALGQGTGAARDQPTDPRVDPPSVDETEGSALPRYAGGAARYALGQRLLLGMLVFLMTVTLILGVLTVAHVLRHHAGPRRPP